MAIQYDPSNPDFEAVRQIFFEYLKSNSRSFQLSRSGEVYRPFVEFVGQQNSQLLAFHISDIFWQLLVEGIVAPGSDSSNQELPWFHLTSYGRMVLADESGHPHDPTGYLARLTGRVSNPDETVLAYVTESLNSFQRSTVVAAAVMLGIAAERVFLLVCDAIYTALGDPQEKADFSKVNDRFAMKPKLDWVHGKLLALQNRRVTGLPENATLMVTTIYDLLRSQRNDLGHPRDLPPKLDREEVFANLQVFPRFYQTADQLCQFLAHNQI